MNYGVLGSALAFLAVALGAFGAHGLAERVSPADLEIWKTAAHYHLIHAAMIAVLGLLAPQIRFAPALFAVGTVVFSGSLYILVLSGVRVWGAVTPIGGVLFLAGWAALGVAAWRR